MTLMRFMTALNLILGLALYGFCCVAFRLQSPIKAPPVSEQVQEVERLIAGSLTEHTPVTDRLAALRMAQGRSLAASMKRSHVITAIVAALSGVANVVTGPVFLIAEVVTIPVAYAMGCRWAMMRRSKNMTRDGLDYASNADYLVVLPLPPVVNAVWFLCSFLIGVLVALVVTGLITVLKRQ